MVTNISNFGWVWGKIWYLNVSILLNFSLSSQNSKCGWKIRLLVVTKFWVFLWRHRWGFQVTLMFLLKRFCVSRLEVLLKWLSHLPMIEPFGYRVRNISTSMQLNRSTNCFKLKHPDYIIRTYYNERIFDSLLFTLNDCWTWTQDLLFMTHVWYVLIWSVNQSDGK